MFSGSIPTVEIYNVNLNSPFSLPPMLASAPVADSAATTPVQTAAVDPAEPTRHSYISQENTEIQTGNQK
jgi:hypothetical protein